MEDTMNNNEFIQEESTSKKLVTVSFKLDPMNQYDKEIIDYIESVRASQKNKEIGKALSKEDIVRTLISKPTKKSKAEVRDRFLATLNDDDMFQAFYRAYKEKNNVEISIPQFAMNVIGKIGEREKKQYINNYLN